MITLLVEANGGNAEGRSDGGSNAV